MPSEHRPSPQSRPPRAPPNFAQAPQGQGPPDKASSARGCILPSQTFNDMGTSQERSKRSTRLYYCVFSENGHFARQLKTLNAPILLSVFRETEWVLRKNAENAQRAYIIYRMFSEDGHLARTQKTRNAPILPNVFREWALRMDVTRTLGIVEWTLP